MDQETETPFDAEQLIVNAMKKRAKQMKEERTKKLWRAIFLDTAAIAAVPLVMLWQGYVLATLWKWFITPVFLIQLNIYFAVGLMLTSRLAIRTQPWGRVDGLLVPLVVLGLGAVWRWLGWGM